MGKDVTVSRRKLLALLSVGGVGASLPSRWTRPLIDAVVLPLHAQASPAAVSAVSSFGGTVLIMDTEEETDVLPAEVCIEPRGGGRYDATVVVDFFALGEGPRVGFRGENLQYGVGEELGVQMCEGAPVALGMLADEPDGDSIAVQVEMLFLIGFAGAAVLGEGPCPTIEDCGLDV